MANSEQGGSDNIADPNDDNGYLTRRLIRQSGTVAMATLLASDQTAGSDVGRPFNSMVLVASDQGGSPLLLISDLAVHSANIAADPRVSLLFEEAGANSDPLTTARVSVQGRARQTTSPQLRQRFLSRFPDASVYADFADFAFYRVAIEAAHLVAGFGRIVDLSPGEILVPHRVDEIADAEKDIVDHMNFDHADAIDLYATNLLGAEESGWTMTGVDCEGCDLRRQSHLLRLNFDRPAHDSLTVRESLIEMVVKARKAGQNL